MIAARMQPGDEVLVWDLAMLVDLGIDAPIVGTVYGLNGDQVDVIDADGEVDCWPEEWCWVRPA